ncbi:Tim44/TimA family putative adaptor protein [Hyphobacterium marinum]|uniref:Tim44/TimA family putative adaptor protein n=1 Tax=Hyphobacterium marinum TaxID=3116574 RepID=A0ABU7LVT8_9PROT|nr:Tim44/TimA family putative adaptor protein [Hyphobacterium sp. Y6023]MEE2565382.1 Tim44/TimA family putative adaptor protein [Hyphobacterium sp. Y6023]
MEVITLLISAAAAVFIAFRLYQVLGRKTGHTPEAPAARPSPPAAGTDTPADRVSGFAGPAESGLTAIAGQDPGFDPGGFLSGADAAYRLIVEGFAKGDKDALRPLLTEKVYARYAAAIDEREARGETTTTEIERIARAGIEDAELDGKTARIRVRFKADIATETKSKSGERISGDLSRIAEVEEIWSFERQADSRDPNWRLAGVKAV